MPDYKLYSADSHVSEPPDLWLTRLDKKWRYRAPKIESMDRDGVVEDYLVYEGFPPHPVAVGIASAIVAKTGDDESKFEFVKSRAGRYAEALPGGWDPAARLKDQDIDGVDGEVLHPTIGFRMFWLKDEQLQQVVFRAYNDWMAELVSHNPKRLVGIALISLYDVAAGVEELQRAARAGLKGCMIALSPPEGYPPYNSPVYFPFWEMAQELDMPVILHLVTGGGESRLLGSYWNPDTIIGAVIAHAEAERTLARLIMFGVLEKFPRLRLHSAENGLAWIPYFLHRMDRQLRSGLVASMIPKLSLKPSEYFKRQVAVSFINEPEAAQLRQTIPIENLMWASDYPHAASTWPKSRDAVAKVLEGVPDNERRKIVRDNVLRYFKISDPAA
jgi:uncharacterized protein